MKILVFIIILFVVLESKGYSQRKPDTIFDFRNILNKVNEVIDFCKEFNGVIMKFDLSFATGTIHVGPCFLGRWWPCDQSSQGETYKIKGSTTSSTDPGEKIVRLDRPGRKWEGMFFDADYRLSGDMFSMRRDGIVIYKMGGVNINFKF